MVHIQENRPNALEMKNLARVREIAPECAVLLKKDGIFRSLLPENWRYSETG